MTHNATYDQQSELFYLLLIPKLIQILYYLNQIIQTLQNARPVVLTENDFIQTLQNARPVVLTV